MRGKCYAKHLDPQPDEQTWRCPDCWTPDKLDLHMEAPRSSFDCDLTHERDEVYCRHCQSHSSEQPKIWKVKDLMAATRKLVQEVPCLCCAGRGWHKLAKGEEQPHVHDKYLYREEPW